MPTPGNVKIEWPRGAGEQALRITTDGAGGVLSAALLPVERLYSAVIAARNFAYDAGVLRTHCVSVPVISIGNIVAGGSGKTPMTRWLTERLIARGRMPAILHGGYGADEPRLHQQWHPGLPVIGHLDRVAGARQAIAHGADVILLDDGFQHRRLARDLDIVLLAADETAANLLPRGPGREPLRALRRSSFVVITRKSAGPDHALLLETKVHQTVPGVPTARVHLSIGDAQIADPVVVATAIARPDLLLAQLMQAGINVQAFLAYPDHYEYMPEDAALITARAADHLLVTTAKDAVKLRWLMPEQTMFVVEQQVVFESAEDDLLSAVDKIL